MAISNRPDNMDAVRSAINRRISSYPPDSKNTNASASKKAIDEQDKELTQHHLAKRVFLLLSAGYIITVSMLILSGWQIGGFYLEPYVLAVLVASSMGSGAYMFQRVMDVILN